MWEKLKHENYKIRLFNCSVDLHKDGVDIYEHGKLKGGFTYPICEDYEEFAEIVLCRTKKTILDITFHQGLCEGEEG